MRDGISTFFFLSVAVAFLIYIVMKGELSQYLAVFGIDTANIGGVYGMGKGLGQ